MGKFIIWKVNASCCLGRVLRGGTGKPIKTEVQAKCGVRVPKGRESKLVLPFWDTLFVLT